MHKDDITEIPGFLRATPERIAEAKAFLERDDKSRDSWVMPSWSPQQGVNMKALDQKFVDIVTAMGFDTQTRHGRDKVLGLADDVAKSREFLAKFNNVDNVEGTDDMVMQAAQVVLREQLQLPKIKGDKEMATAAKKVAKATAKAKKGKAPKAKAERKPRERGTEPKEGTKARALWDLLKKGATMKELLKACGWKACSAYIHQMAKDYNRELVRSENKDGESKWKLA